MLAGMVAVWTFSCVAGQHWVGVGNRVLAWTNSLPADRIRLGVRDEGVYQVSAAEIASASGVSIKYVWSELYSNGLALSNGLKAVRWTTDGKNLYFFGEPTTELFAPENVYWLSFGQGNKMETFEAAPEAGSSTNQWFMCAQSYRSAFLSPYDPRDRRSTNGSLTNVLNFGKWIPGSSTESTRAKSQTVTLPGFSAVAETGVTARISAVSYYDFLSPDDHTCEVWLNGQSCGSRSWSGEQALVFDCTAAQGVVTNGPVQIKIRNGLTAQLNDFMLLDATLIYPHTYCAVSNAVLCTGGGSKTVAVNGFTANAVGVWDITEPLSPAMLHASAWPETNGTWSVAFACGDASARYAVFEVPEGCFLPSVSGVRDTDWNDPAEMPELAIVIPPRRWVSGFAEAVQPLADFRTAQGLKTRIIDAEELYNAFSGGLAHPAAFARFSAAGVTNGAVQTLRYLLFAGSGGSDYKLEVFGFGERGPFPTLFPLYLFPQVDTVESAALILPNDPVLGDATGDAVPEVAVGRFIATNAVELARMVAKTIRYELTETWKNKALFVASNLYYSNDPDFSNIVSQVASGFAPGGWTVKGFFPKPPNPSYAMNVLWDNTYDQPPTGVRYELSEGAGFLYYFGHSSDSILGVGTAFGSYFINKTTFQTGTWPFAPVAMLMGCRVGRWMQLDMKTQVQGIAEAGVRNPVSGFAAVISAGGYLQNSEALIFSNGFRDCIAAGALRLGDAWCGAFEAAGGTVSARMRHMTLLGDPSLCIRAGVTARGTPSSWLITQGLSGDPYADLKDPDADGFATWQEYQAGTSYSQKALKIRGLSSPGSLDGVALTFETVAGMNYRVVSTTNLASGVWEPAPWKTDAAGAWSWSGIPVDWPVKTVVVPFETEEQQRFYKVESYGQ